MPRGKRTLKPVKILAHKSNMCNDLSAEAEKGSTVHYFPGDHDPLDTYDVVLGPNMWRCTNGMEPMIKHAITSAKNTRYVKAGKRSGGDDEESDD